MQTQEIAAIEPGVIDGKYYALGVGSVYEATVRGGRALAAGLVQGRVTGSVAAVRRGVAAGSSSQTSAPPPGRWRRAPSRRARRRSRRRSPARARCRRASAPRRRGRSARTRGRGNPPARSPGPSSRTWSTTCRRPSRRQADRRRAPWRSALSTMFAERLLEPQRVAAQARRPAPASASEPARARRRCASRSGAATVVEQLAASSCRGRSGSWPWSARAITSRSSASCDEAVGLLGRRARRGLAAPRRVAAARAAPAPARSAGSPSGVRSSWLASATNCALAREGALEPVEHLVQRPPSRRDLVAGRRRRAGARRASRRDARRPAAHRLDRPQRGGGDAVAASEASTSATGPPTGEQRARASRSDSSRSPERVADHDDPAPAGRPHGQAQHARRARRARRPAPRSTRTAPAPARRSSAGVRSARGARRSASSDRRPAGRAPGRSLVRSADARRRAPGRRPLADQRARSRPSASCSARSIVASRSRRKRAVDEHARDARAAAPSRARTRASGAAGSAAASDATVLARSR